MKKYEYEVSQRSVIAGSPSLNEFGRNGWELVSITHLLNNRFPMVYTFKRETPHKREST